MKGKNWFIMATDEIDLHNERLDEKVLLNIVETLNSNNLLCFHEHDYTNPPIGIWDDAKIIEEKGIKYVYGHLNLFDSSHNSKSEKVYLSENYDIDGDFEIITDRNFEIDLSLKRMVEDLSKKENIKIRSSIKKSVNFNPEFIIKFVAFSVATGFFNSLGEDLYKTVKNRIKLIKDRTVEKNKMMHFIVEYPQKLSNGEKVIFKLIYEIRDKKNKIKIDEKFLENQLKDIIESKVSISEVVNVIKKGKIKFAYSLKKNGEIYKMSNKCKNQFLKNIDDFKRKI